MKTRIILLLLCISAAPLFAQNADFVFRNDFRPVFARTINATQLQALAGDDSTVIIDVRLAEDFAKDPALIPGATHLNPEELPLWLSGISKDKEVIVYCVAGKWVSQKVAYLLDESGIRVRSLEGGIEAWKQQQAQ